MLRVNVSITNVSAERFLDARKRLPQIQISTNLNLVEVEKKKEGILEVPFVMTVNYTPSVAQISLKGKAYVAGDGKEVDKILKEYKEKKPPSQVIVQTISNIVFVESVLISRTLNVPPPIPLPKISTRGPSEKGLPKMDYSA